MRRCPDCLEETENKEHHRIWLDALNAAKAEQRLAQEELTVVNKKMKKLRQKKNQVRQELADADKAVNAAVYALKTGLNPK